jgi:two-component system sensor histidine kinase/response regulator
MREDLQLPLTSRRVLVAEDNDTAGQLMCDLLRIWGYQVELVTNGQAAVEKVKERRFDLVLMDCHMPVMDGWEATREIRSIGGKLPIVAVTGEGDRDLCMQAGMDDYLEKPVRPTVLRATLNRWLERGGRRSSPPPVSSMTVRGS